MVLQLLIMGNTIPAGTTTHLKTYVTSSKAYRNLGFEGLDR